MAVHRLALVLSGRSMGLVTKSANDAAVEIGAQAVLNPTFRRQLAAVSINFQPALQHAIQLARPETLELL